MFDAPNEARLAAGYLLVLGAGVVFYMRCAFLRAASDLAARSSVTRIIVSIGWGGAIATYVMWPDVVRRWNFFMFPQVRWFTTVPAAIGILLIIWAMRSQLRLDENGNIATNGPYKWCRYPFDAALSVFFVSVTLLCANWLLISITLVLIALLRLGVPSELERVRRVRLGAAYDRYAAGTGWFLPSSTSTAKAQYQVPSRFGLTAIMGLLTVLAIIFGTLRAFEAPAVIYLFIGSEIMAICLVQILVGSAPRGGSALTGAILLPFWAYWSLRIPAAPPSLEWLLMVILFLFGGLLGYCIGTLAAGFFLMMDLIEPWLIRDATAAYPLPPPDFLAQGVPSDTNLMPPSQRKAIQAWPKSRS